MVKIVVPAAVAALVLGLVLGYFLGRAATERQWSSPYAEVSPADEAKASSAKDAAPTPRAGTRVLKSMPIGRARLALASTTAKDPVLAPVVAFGSGRDGIELHVVVENQGKCTVKSLEGVAYGFDPYGMPAKANAAGEPYVAFSFTGTLDPGKKELVAARTRHAETATLAVAHVDRTTCTDGTSWARQ